MPETANPEAPTVATILAELEANAFPAVRKIYAKQGIAKAFGVKMGDLRIIAKTYKKRHALGLALWDTGWFEARVLATMVMVPKDLTEADGIRLAESSDGPAVLDKLTGYVLAESTLAGALRDRWLDLDDPLLGRAGWNLMTEAVQRDEAGAIDLDALLAKIEAELPAAPRPKKEAMNMCLVMVGVYHPSHMEKAIAAGERLGRWDDRPVPKGCYSSYPPEWIPAAIRLRKKR